MKKIITIQKIKSCDKCPYLTGGFYGNGQAGGYVYYCKKKYRKKISNTRFYFDAPTWDEVCKIANKTLQKFQAWCPLEDY